jgi:hypothetical protein
LDDDTTKAILQYIQLENKKAKELMINNNNILKYETHGSNIIKVHSMIPFTRIIYFKNGVNIYSHPNEDSQNKGYRVTYDYVEGKEYNIVNDILKISGISDFIIGLDAHTIVVIKDPLVPSNDIIRNLSYVLISYLTNQP